MSTIFKPKGPERYAHQKRGVKRLIRQHGVGALLFDPGLGKTATVIDYLSILALKAPTQEVRVLVVAPLAAVDTWVYQMERYVADGVNFWAEAVAGSLPQRAETLASRGGNPFGRQLSKTRRREGSGPRSQHFERSWAWECRPADSSRERGPDGVPGPRIVLEVINIDTLTSRSRVGSRTMADVMVEAIRRFGPDVVVVDELHKIKGASANASRLLSRVAPHVKRRIGLTGTVMPHGPLDVFGQWRFLDPYAFGETKPDGSRKQATFGGFRERFAVLGGWMGKEVIGYRNLDEMQDIMGEIAVVARKEEALDLPRATDVELTVDLSPAESRAYAQMKAALATDFADGTQATVSSMLTQALRLRQITSGHLPGDDGTVRTVGDSKVRTIRSLVHDTLVGEKRIVIFALFTHEIQALGEALRQQGTEVMMISGGTSGEERLAMRRRFGSDEPTRMVMVAQIKTMSLAVNELITASHAIFASLSQQRDDWIQAKDRLNRIGQTRPMTFWHAVVPGTVDEVILESHRQGTSLENAVLAHIRSGE